jgi:hypothetical protein
MEVFNLTSRRKVFEAAKTSNFNAKTYRFSMNAPEDFLISLRILKKVLNSLFKPLITREYAGNNSGIAIFDTNLGYCELRYNYINRLSQEKPDVIIGREELLKMASPGISILILLWLIIDFPITAIKSILSSNKLKYPFHLMNMIEAINLNCLLRKYKIKKLHFFCIYESDSNLLAYVLMKNGLLVNKIPSEVPLLFWNKIIVASTLGICFKYQEEELKKYNETMFIDSFNAWVPESSFELEKIYNNQNRSTPPLTVGFYSSGMWLRKQMNTLDLVDAEIYEMELLNYVFSILEENRNWELKIYLHPLEKQYLKETKCFYSQFSDTINYGDVAKSNPTLFYNSSIVVSLYSTMAFERVFWGFKTIIFPIGQDEFPIRESPLNNICVKSKIELRNKLTQAMPQSAEEYFTSNKLADYLYYNYDFFSV